MGKMKAIWTKEDEPIFTYADRHCGAGVGMCLNADAGIGIGCGIWTGMGYYDGNGQGDWFEHSSGDQFGNGEG